MTAIPLSYNLRNLRLRWRTTLFALFGIALVVSVFILVMALAKGMKATYLRTGDPLNLLVLRRGSTAESSSQILREDIIRLKYLSGIRRDEQNRPLFSPEIIVLIYLNRVGEPTGGNVLMRGMSELGLALRPNVRLVAGRMFQTGRRECIVSKRIADRFEGCRIGDRFHAGKAEWTVVGIFDAEKTAYESEIWADADEVREAFNRNFYGSALIRPVDEAAAVALIARIESDRTLNTRVIRETEYYREQTKTAAPIQFLGSFLAVVMSIGAAFSAMNTMYAAVGARVREIGTLRVLGFKRRAIYVSFLVESVLLAAAGGLLGCLIALPLNGMATGGFSWTTFSEIAFEFRVTPGLLAQGMAFALAMGILGGLLPARMAARKPILEALKSQ